MYALMIVSLGTTMSFAQNAGKEIATGVKVAEKVAAGAAKNASKAGIKVSPRFKGPKLPQIYVPAFNTTPSVTLSAVSRARIPTDEKVVFESSLQNYPRNQTGLCLA